jgi:Holliday junction resolvase RusA-like endonuclease
MMRARFVYRGTVRGQGRPRFGNGRTYEAAEDRAYKKAIAAAYKEQCGEWFGDAELRVSIHVSRPLPKSRPKRIEWEPDTCKPDADNIAKAVLDSLNGIAFEDDRQASEVSTVKHPRRRGLETDLLIVEIETIERNTHGKPLHDRSGGFDAA